MESSKKYSIHLFKILHLCKKYIGSIFELQSKDLKSLSSKGKLFYTKKLEKKKSLIDLALIAYIAFESSLS